VLVVADGAPWIGKVVADRWASTTQLLDFYHASQHLWEVGRALKRGDESQAAAWVERRLHRLRHGQERAVVGELAVLPLPRGPAREVVRREQNYFAAHSQRMNYQQLARRGWPIGSGAVEAACRQRQGRFKRPRQFWTTQGLRHLAALVEVLPNGHWDELWQAN
jgi:hypothetical protein